MKKDLIFSLALGLLCFFTMSLALVNEKPLNTKLIVKKTTIKGGKSEKPCTCNANVTNFTIIRDSGGWITFGWNYTGDAVAFNYGGYYN